VHDPALLRYLAGVVYLGVAALAWRASGPQQQSERKLWLGIAAAVFLFGIGKALNLQEQLLDALRSLAKRRGWYAWHTEAQLVFVLIIGVLLVVVGKRLWARTPPPRRSVRLAIVTTMLLTAFIAVRGASIHVVDQWVVVDAGGIRAGWWAELAALLILAAAAISSSSMKR
jgi:hypothetical protein